MKSWLKVILGIILVAAVGTSLWFSTPLRALTVSISDPDPTTLSKNIRFDVTLNIDDPELLPVQSIDLYIENSNEPGDYSVTCIGLPLSDGANKHYESVDTGGGDVDVDVTSNLSYLAGLGYVVWNGTPYTFGPGFGYGYGFGTGGKLEYHVVWDSPQGWPTDPYEIKLTITADSTTFTETLEVVLRRAAAGGGGGGFGPTDTTAPRISGISISGITRTTADIYWTTHELSDSQVEYWSLTPSLFSELDSEMVTSHYIHLTGLTPGTQYSYKTMSRDTAGNLAVSEELIFTTLGTAAAFDVRQLDITPAEVEAGNEVTISAVVYNTGDATGSYEVTLMVDGNAVATKEVTLAGGAGETVTFPVTMDEAKTYSVEVDGLSGTFVVRAAAPPVPTPPPPTPVTPTPVTPPPEPISWWLIGGIIAASVAVAVVVWMTVIRQRA